MTLAERLKTLKTRIQKAKEKSRFAQGDITLMGASKSQGLNSIRQAAELGVLDMGENFAQELLKKAPLCLDMPVRWHFIGRLQSNKIKHLIPYVTSVGSVDSLELADRIARVREQMENPRPPVPILLQVNLGSERQKAGLPPRIIENLFEQFLAIDGIRVAGIMTIPPLLKDAERMRPYFKEMKQLFDTLKPKHPAPDNFNVLSMGMSADFEVAIEEGSNCVRIGEALFGPRAKTASEED